MLLNQIAKNAIRRGAADEAITFLEDARTVLGRLRHNDVEEALFGGALRLSMGKNELLVQVLMLLAKAHMTLGHKEEAVKFHDLSMQAQKQPQPVKEPPAPSVWAQPLPEAQIGQYGWSDSEDGAGTVELYIAAEHVGGHNIPSAQHVRVETTADSLEVRIRAAPGVEHVLWLCPLSNAIVPQDTVHRVRRGKLKVTLFKAEKKVRWFVLASVERKARKRVEAEPEELDEAQMAALPKPVASRCDNVPAAAAAAIAAAPAAVARWPSWVEAVQRDGASVKVVVAEGTGLADLSVLRVVVAEVEGDGGSVRVERAGHPEPLVLEAGARAAWSKKRRTLTLTAD